MENDHRPTLSLLFASLALIVGSAVFASFQIAGYSVFCLGMGLLSFGEYSRRRLAYLIVRCTNEIVSQDLTPTEREALLPELLDKLLVD